MKNLIAVVLMSCSSATFAAVPQPFGAIAYSPADRLYGVAVQQVNQEAAEQAAMGQCAVTAGGRDCRVVVWFHDACGVLVRDDANGAWGADYGVTTRGEQMAGINAAGARARQHCQDAGGTNCALVQAICSFDPN